MGKPDAFIETKRKNFDKQGINQRLGHFCEFYLPLADDELRQQASRCMDCGVPFCHSFGCPLGNLIPEWNDLIFRGHWKEACELLHSTNNFPEFTGRLCPALCEAACTLGLNSQAVTVRQNEYSIVERGWSEGWIKPQPPRRESGKSVAVVGSGPAGMAAAQQLRRAGHAVALFEKAPRLGGILRFGIPDYKLDKCIIDRRLEQMKAEGVIFEAGVNVGVDVSPAYLMKRYDAVCICIGASAPRDLPVPGRELAGVHFAMDYLVQQNYRNAGLAIDGPEITARDKHVVIIGGGDTGVDCLGTALRQGALSVHQFEIMPRPPACRDASTPWPQWPLMLRNSTSHEEGGERRWCVETSEFLGRKGVLTGLRGHEVAWAPGARSCQMVEGSQFEMEADLVLLAMGFVHPRKMGLLDQMGLKLDARGNVQTDAAMATSTPGVFAAGDANTGQSLVVWALSAGRRMAHFVDAYLMGSSNLPCPDLMNR